MDRRPARAIAGMLVLLVALPAAFAQPTTSESSAPPPCEGFHHMPGIGDVCPRVGGLFEVFAPGGGRSLGFTHGPDPHCEGCEEPLSAQGSVQPHCVAGAAGEHYVRVIYARANDDSDQYASRVGLIRDLVAQSNAMVDDAAVATGDRLAIRVLCSGGIVVVENAVLPTPRAAASFSTIVNDLQNMGFNDHRQKYWVYYDDMGACACAGAGHIYMDESDSVNNLNNGPSNAVPMFAVSFGSASVRTMLHELGHNLGAVQDNAPRSTRAGHCVDGRDTMCYNDGGPNGAQYSISHCSVEAFDCKNDTYCHANPAPGSYLDTRWQACHRQSRFLAFGGNEAPVMTSLTCSPDPSYPEETMSCSFSASDGGAGVHYLVEWGDGATTRVPAVGTATPGVVRSASHAYASQSTPTVRVTATDIGTPPMSSAPMTRVHTVGAPNAPPAFDAVSCSPQTPDEGQTVTCTFSAQDLDSVFYTVGWGDGTPTVRVPSSGTVEPGAPQSASHVYGRGGTFTLSVSATDAGRPPKTGSTTHALPVTEVNTAPTLTTVTCPSAPQRHHVSFACSFLAQDDSNGVRYRVDWGDGTVEEVPAQGFTAPGVATAARHAYAADGTYVVAVSAFDDASPPASSGVRTATVQVQDDQAPPSLSIEDPRMGRWYIGCGQSGSKGIGLALFITKGCVRATAHDPSGVARVEVYRNGALLALDATPPYEIEFNIARFGPAEYDVRAVDVHGYARTLPFSADAIGGSG